MNLRNLISFEFLYVLKSTKEILDLSSNTKLRLKRMKFSQSFTNQNNLLMNKSLLFLRLEVRLFHLKVFQLANQF
jgi:hypothetical protein